MKRRFFFFAAPAIVAAPSLMRVSTLPATLIAAPFPSSLEIGAYYAAVAMQGALSESVERILRPQVIALTKYMNAALMLELGAAHG